jgi:Protein of unknown function (DUF1351)
MVDHNDLVLNVQQIVVKQGSIEFFEFEELKKQAEALAEQIKTVEVDEENIKQSKKLLAAVNKRIKELEDKRILIKKAMMEPYQNFESQVKEIVSIVREADDTVRQQVRDLEEMERLQKEGQLHGIFEKRIRHYSFRDLFKFADFLKPKHLNKSTSIDEVENEMIAFFDKVSRDLKAIEKMPEAKTILSAYLDHRDLASAIFAVEKEKERIQQIEASKAIKTAKSKISFLVSIAVKNQKDLKFLEMLLKENEIQYSIDKIENGGN